MKIKDSRAPAAPEKASAEEAKRRNLEHYGLKIKSFRLRAGLSADELADRLQISKSSVRNWECGLTRPDPELLYRIFGLLDVEPNEFFGVKGVGTLLTSREQELVSHFRSLDSAGREDALAVLEALSSVSERRRLLSALERMTVVPDAGRLAAADPARFGPDLASTRARLNELEAKISS